MTLPGHGGPERLAVVGDGSYQSIVKTIREGVASPKQHTGVMPPMGGAQLTPAQVAAVGAYVFALSHPSGS
jgi:mono/diheme cytochrome c family protein